MQIQNTLLALLLAAGCDGPAATESSPRGVDPRVEVAPAPPSTSIPGLAGHPPVDGYPGGPGSDGVLGPEWEDELASREVDYAAALRTASLRLRGDLPTLLEVRFVSEAPDPRVAYEAMIDAFLGDDRFTRQLLSFFRDAMKMGGNAELDAAPLFATELVVEERPFGEVFTAQSGTCPTYDGATRTIEPADCDNGVATHAGVLTNPGVQKHFFSNLGFRRVRWLQETFACRAFPAEWDEPRDIGGAAPYTSPWPFESIAGAGTGGRIDFHDTSSVICANCHTTINHLAPLFGRFDGEGMWSDDFAVPLPLPEFPLAVIGDWLPVGETTAWRHGQPVVDLPALGAAMAADPDVASCMVSRVWNWAYGKGDIVTDLHTVPRSVLGDLLDTHYIGSGGRLLPVIRAIYTGDDFVRF